MALVDDLRGLVAAGTAEYTDGSGTAYWTTTQLQAALDSRRYLTFEEPLTYFTRTTLGTGGQGTLIFDRARIDAPGRFEAGTAGGTITDSLGSTVSGWTLARDGWIDFTANQAGSVRYLSAWTYDLYAAAADVLEAWASNVKLHFDAQTDDQSFTRSQKHQMLMEQAKQYRRKQIVHVVPITTTSEC